MSCAVNLIGLDGCMIVETLLEDNFHSNRGRLLQCSEGGPFLLVFFPILQRLKWHKLISFAAAQQQHNKMANMASPCLTQNATCAVHASMFVMAISHLRVMNGYELYTVVVQHGYKDDAYIQLM